MGNPLDDLIKTIEPLGQFSSLFGGSGGTKVATSNKSNVATQLSIGIANQIGAGSPSATGGTQSAPSTQTTSEGAQGYSLPVFGANQSMNPEGQLNSLLTGNSGISNILGNKALMLVLGASVAAGALFFGLKGGK